MWRTPLWAAKPSTVYPISVCSKRRVGPVWFASDPMAEQSRADSVFLPDSSSWRLARSFPDALVPPNAPHLDIGTGCGVVAACRVGRSITMVNDCNPRALDLAYATFALNGQAPPRTVAGDFEVLRGAWASVTFNLPTLGGRAGRPVHTSTKAGLLARVLEWVGRHLDSPGICMMHLNLPVSAEKFERDAGERLRSLGMAGVLVYAPRGRRGSGLLLLRRPAVEPAFRMLPLPPDQTTGGDHWPAEMWPWLLHEVAPGATVRLAPWLVPKFRFEPGSPWRLVAARLGNSELGPTEAEVLWQLGNGCPVDTPLVRRLVDAGVAR
jgi:hypothetical protein